MSRIPTQPPMIMMNSQELHTAAANEVLVAAAPGGSLSGSSPSGNDEPDRQEATEEDDSSKGENGLIFLAHQPNDDDAPLNPSSSALSIKLSPLRNNMESTQPLPAVQPPSPRHLDGAMIKEDRGIKEQYLIQKAHATWSGSSSQLVATTVSTESSSEGSSNDNNSDKLVSASSEQGGGDDQKLSSQQNQRGFPPPDSEVSETQLPTLRTSTSRSHYKDTTTDETASNKHNKPLAATKAPLQEDSPRLVASLSLDTPDDYDGSAAAAAAPPPPLPAHCQADHSRKQQQLQQAVQKDALATFGCTRDDDHNKTGMRPPRILKRRKVPGQESPKQKCARSDTDRESSSLPPPSTELVSGRKAVVIARESEDAEDFRKSPAIPSSGNAGVSPSSAAGTSLTSAKVETAGESALPDEEQARKLFLCQRNAMYARRKYARKKIETEVLQHQCLSLEDLNHRLKLEQRRLEGLVDRAKQTVFFVDSVGAGHVLASMEATHSMPPSIRSTAANTLSSTNNPLLSAHIQQQQGSTADLSRIPVTQIPDALHNFSANNATLTVATKPSASLSSALGFQAETSNAVSAAPGFLNVETLCQLQALESLQMLSSRHGGDLSVLLNAIQNPNVLELQQSAGALVANPVLGRILLLSQLQQASPLSLLSRLVNDTQVQQAQIGSNALGIGNLGALQGVQTNQSASQQLTQQVMHQLALQQLLQGATGGSTTSPFPDGSSNRPNQSDRNAEQREEYQRS